MWACNIKAGPCMEMVHGHPELCHVLLDIIDEHKIIKKKHFKEMHMQLCRNDDGLKRNRDKMNISVNKAHYQPTVLRLIISSTYLHVQARKCEKYALLTEIIILSLFIFNHRHS